MSDQFNFHWTESEELLSRYVLDRISKEERKKLDDHLATCQQCRAAVQREQNLLSGIRQYGRDQLRSRLKQNLVSRVEARHSIATWQRALSAAAVVVILAGIGYYNQWFTWKKQMPHTMADELQLQSQAEGKSEARESELKGGVTHEQARRSEPSGNNELGRRAEAEQSMKPAFGISKKDNEGLNGMENAVSAPSAGGAISMGEGPAKSQSLTMTAQPGESGFWVEGSILPGHITMEKKGRPKNLEAKRNTPKSKMSAQRAGQPASEAKLLGQSAVTVSQQSVGLLPTTRQQVQQSARQSIQAHVQQSGEGFNLTVYPSTLFGEEDLQHARVEQVAPDSLIVILGSQILGFRMPSGFLESQSSQVKSPQK